MNVAREQRRGPAGRLRHGESLADHTFWGIGGPAARFYEPLDADDLCAFLAALDPAEPLLWIGLGSNLLVRDGGFDGTVVHLAGALESVRRVADRRVRAESGAACPKVARWCAREGLGGCEFLAGIPGTLGGALAMNAGAFGGETWAWVGAVETVDRRGVRRRRTPNDYRIGYRSVIPVDAAPGGEWFLAAELALCAGDSAAARARIKALLARRGATQPLGSRSCGSVFRNPPGDHAARLIERCGLKGKRIGSAVISPKHANFIVNEGGASAADVEALMELIVTTVEARCGVRLTAEVRIVGRRAEVSR